MKASCSEEKIVSLSNKKIESKIGSQNLSEKYFAGPTKPGKNLFGPKLSIRPSSGVVPGPARGSIGGFGLQQLHSFGPNLFSSKSSNVYFNIGAISKISYFFYLCNVVDE